MGNELEKRGQLFFLVGGTKGSLSKYQAWKFSAFPRISAFFPILEFFPRFFNFLKISTIDITERWTQNSTC